MPSTEKLDTHRKALDINLDKTSYGSFAEIGAGQEVARWFLVAGGASGTVAKSISAYDKEVSDGLYGPSTRYVSKERLEAMLDGEWKQLIRQLDGTRGATTRFFSFVDTVSARNFSGTNEPHGWVGLRFQLQPGGPMNQVILHINLLDPSTPLEQEAIGILGVNLIYAAFYQLQAQDSFLLSTAQDIRGRIEIDFVETLGPAFDGWDQRILLVQLVCEGLAEVVYFPSGRAVVPPIDLLHKKAVVLAPGSFQQLDSTQAAFRMLTSGIEELRGESDEDGRELAIIGLYCLSAMPLWDTDVPPSVSCILERIHLLLASGGEVLLFRERELYSMTALVNRYTKERVRFVIGLSLLVRTWEYRYTRLGCSFLEALSRLFAQNVRIYAYPMRAENLEQAIQSISATGWQWGVTGGWVSARELRPAPPMRHLYDYVLASNFLVPIPIPSERMAGTTGIPR